MMQAIRTSGQLGSLNYPHAGRGRNSPRTYSHRVARLATPDPSPYAATIMDAAQSPPSPSPARSLSRQVAGWLAAGPWCGPARRLMEQNLVRYDLPLSKVGKVAAGSWLILRDYADGLFPPRFEDQQAA